MACIVRRAGLDDLDALAVLFDAYRQFYAQRSDIPAARAFLEQRLQNGESVILVAIADDRSAGFTQLYPLFTSVGLRRTWLLNDLFVISNARRRGVATALMSAAHEHARDTGAASVLLETQISNRDAQALYEKLGYRRNEETWFYQLRVTSDE